MFQTRKEHMSVQHNPTAFGDLRALAEFSRAHFSDAGTLDHHAFGLVWDPRPLLQLVPETR